MGTSNTNQVREKVATARYSFSRTEKEKKKILSITSELLFIHVIKVNHENDIYFALPTA